MKFSLEKKTRQKTFCYVSKPLHTSFYYVRMFFLCVFACRHRVTLKGFLHNRSIWWPWSVNFDFSFNEHSYRHEHKFFYSKLSIKTDEWSMRCLNFFQDCLKKRKQAKWLIESRKWKGTMLHKKSTFFLQKDKLGLISSFFSFSFGSRISTNSALSSILLCVICSVSRLRLYRSIHNCVSIWIFDLFKILLYSIEFWFYFIFK